MDQSNNYPVYHTFQAKDLNSDNLVLYRVQKLPKSYYETALLYLKNYFLPKEALCSAAKVLEDPVSLQEILDFWQGYINQNLTLACFKEGSDELIGLNVMYLETFDSPHYECQGEKWKYVHDAIEYTLNKVNIFEKYGVDKYLSAMGLTVDDRYQGRGIAKEIVKARVPLCQSLGLKLISNIWSEFGAYVAQKVGYKLDTEVTYAELLKAGLVVDKLTPEKSLKVMSLEV